MELTYEVVLEPSDQGGFTVFVPALQGCVSEGATEEEALENIKDAIQGWLEVWEEIEQEEAAWLRRTVVISR